MADRGPISVAILNCEESQINNYAMFVGYLLMGVRGLGVLILTWSTVVLLGGFVSMLQTEDFWALTIITLVQTVGVFNFLLREKLTDVLNSVAGLLVAIGSTIIRPNGRYPSIRREAVGLGLLVVQLMLFAILLCPLAILYILGLYVSSGVSLWRLIKHDYGSTDQGANLSPALDVLYSLAVAQGVLFCYRAIYAYGARIGLAKVVARAYSLDTEIVTEYMEKIVTGCTENPSFSKYKNLVTYAVEMMTESKSRERYISGVTILGTLIKLENTTLVHSSTKTMVEQWILIKQVLVRSTSFIQIIQKLLETIGPRSPYSRDIRENAARIVAHVASDIHLEQFPRGIQCISSLLDTYEMYDLLPDVRYGQLPKQYERPWFLESYEKKCLRQSGPQLQFMSSESESSNSFDYCSELVLQGLTILWKLAVDEDNCRLISNSQILLSKITALLVSGIHREQPEEWSQIAEAILELISRLMAAPGETGRKLQREMSGNKEVLRTMECIIKYNMCDTVVQKKAIGILFDLSIDISSIIPNGENSTIFIQTLLDLFMAGRIRGSELPSRSGKMFDRYYSSSIHWMRKHTSNINFAGEKLLAMLTSGNDSRSTTLIFQVVADEKLFGIITTTMIVVRNKIYRMRAAEILKHLCSHNTNNDENLKKLKEEMSYVLPEVLKILLGYGPNKVETQAAKEANNAEFQASGTDLEGGIVQKNNSSHELKDEKIEDNKLQESFISLCRVICDRWINIDPGLARKFNDITAKTCSEQGKPVKDFISLVEEAYEHVRKMARGKNKGIDMVMAAVPATSSIGT